MGFFHRRNAIRSIQGRLEAHEERLDDHQRAMRTLKLEWEETYDKIHRLFGRIAKRTAIDTPPLTPPVDPDPPPGDGIDEISAKIHARRSMGRH